MTPLALFYPVLAQVLLTFVLLGVMGHARTGYLKTSKTNPAKIALGESIYPPNVKKIENAFHNQLELPILFYAGVLFAIVFGMAGPVLTSLAWLFVVLRVAHAVVHTGGNKVPLRAAIFAGNAATLLAMWVWLAIKVST